MLIPIGTRIAASEILRTRSPEEQARMDKLSLEFKDTLKRAEAAEAAAEIENKKRDQKNEPIYGLLYKGNDVVGYLMKDGGAVFINGGVLDGDAMARAAQTAKGRADWIEANVEGVTVKRFSEGDETPTVLQANTMMNNAAIRRARENPVRWTAPDEDDETGAKGSLKQAAKRLANYRVPTPPTEADVAEKATAERWQRNMTWHKTDKSA